MPLPDPPFPQYVTCANVREYGAVGDGTTDDTQAILNAIDALKNGSGMTDYDGVGLIFPIGIYKVTDTLLFHGLMGLNVMGAGSVPSTSQLGSGGYIGSAIRLTIPGDPTDGPPVLHFKGCIGVRVSGLTIIGNDTYDDEDPRSRQGVLIETDGGAACYVFEDVKVLHCEDGFAAGVIGTELVSSDMTFIRCGAGWCNRGFVAAHQQALNYNFVSPTFDYCDDAIYLEKGDGGFAGGSVVATQVATYNVHRLVVQEKISWNGGQVAIYQARLDSHAEQFEYARTQLYVRGSDLNESWPGRATFHNVHGTVSQTDPSIPRLVVGPGDHIILENCTGLDVSAGLLIDVKNFNPASPPPPPASPQWTVVDINGCNLEQPLEADVVGAVESNSTYQVRMRRNITDDFKPLPDVDFGTQLRAGFATVAYKTTDQSSIGTSYEDVDETGLPLLANEAYAFEFVLYCSTNDNGIAINVACNGPASPTSVMYEQIFWNASTGRSQRFADTYDANPTDNTGGTNQTVRLYRVRGIVRNGANAGTLIARVNRESGGAGGTDATVYAGSYGTLTRLT